MGRTSSDMYDFLLDDDEKKSVPKAPAFVTAEKDAVPAALQRKTANYTPQTPWTPKEQKVEAPVKERKPSLDIPPVSDYDNFSQLVKQYTSVPMTKEEQERRERGAVAAQSMGALGNVLSAFSNLAFTGGVAPSQKLPELPAADKDVQAFRAQVEKSRQAYLNNLLQGRALQQKGEELGLRRADLARRVNADEREAENKKALNDAKIGRMGAMNSKDEAQRAYWDEKTRALEEGQPLVEAEKRARIAYWNRKANSGGSGNYVNVQIADPVTGELKTIPVTGNKAAELIANQEIDESNKSSTNSVDAFGGRSSKTTERGKSAKQKSGEHTRARREEEEAKKKAKAEKKSGSSGSHTKALGL